MYIYGKNVAKEFIKGEKPIFKAILSKNFKEEDILKSLQKKQILIEWKEKREMDEISFNHQGIILQVPDYKYVSLDEIKENTSFIVLLDHLEDPHNLGAIIRTCEAAGVEYIIIPKNRSIEINSTVMKTSAGALENMKIVQVTNLVQTMKHLKKQGFWFYGTDMDGQNYTELSYQGKIGLVIGSEGFGMSRLVKEECDFIASIPMKGKINSLNASVATGIVVYEAVRQRK